MEQAKLFEDKIEFQYVESVIGSGYEVQVAELAPVICFDCVYHADTLMFCQTQREMDSIQAIFNTGCEHDSLICIKSK